MTGVDDPDEAPAAPELEAARDASREDAVGLLVGARSVGGVVYRRRRRRRSGGA